MFEWQPPKHGTVAFPRLTTGEPVEAFCDRCVQQAGVLLLPATVYDHEPSTAQVRWMWTTCTTTVMAVMVGACGCVCSTSTHAGPFSHWHWARRPVSVLGSAGSLLATAPVTGIDVGVTQAYKGGLGCRLCLQSLHILLQPDNLQCIAVMSHM